jgi:hypothetical protein
MDLFKAILNIIYFYAIIIALLLLFCSRTNAQAIFEEDFTGDVYGAEWTMDNEGATFDIELERIEGDFGCCLSGEVDYANYQFYADSLSTKESIFDVRGYIWKDNTTGNRSSMLGIWASTTEYIGIAADNVYNDNKLSLLIRNGGAPGTFAYNFDSGLNPVDSTNYYRVTYERTTDSVRFYYWNSGWTQLGTTQYLDFDSTQFKVGTFHGLFNATAGGSTHSDSLWVSYSPVGYEFITVEYPSAAGLAFNQDSVITIEWDNQVAGFDTTIIYYSTDSGASWTLIDIVGNSDTTYNWTIPGGILTNDALVMATDVDSTVTDQSDFTFIILPLSDSYTDIQIINVTPQPMVAGGDLNIYVQSAYLETFQLLWTYDSSSTYTNLTQETVDTVNGNILDTTLFVWDSPNVSGIFYLKAIEVRSSVLTYDEDTIQYAGTRIKAGNCFDINITKLISDCGGDTDTLTGSEGIHNVQAIWDPSCGWNSNVTWRFYDVNLRENSNTGYPYHSSSYILCEACRRQCTGGCTGCSFPIADLFEIHDTILDSRARVTAGTEGSVIILNNRRYTLANSDSRYYIMVEDLLNPGLQQILVEYTSGVNLGGFGNTKLVEDFTEHTLATYLSPFTTWKSKADSSYTEGSQQIYVMKNGTTTYDDSLHNRLLDSLGLGFGDYNLGYILVGDNEGFYNTYFASILPEPTYAIPISEDIVQVVGVSTRNYFRGVVPEAILEWTGN